MREEKPQRKFFGFAKFLARFPFVSSFQDQIALQASHWEMINACTTPEGDDVMVMRSRPLEIAHPRYLRLATNSRSNNGQRMIESGFVARRNVYLDQVLDKLPVRSCTALRNEILDISKADGAIIKTIEAELALFKLQVKAWANGNGLSSA